MGDAIACCAFPFQILYIASSLGIFLGLAVLGIYMMLKSWNYNVDTFNLIPLISLSWSVFMASLAVLTFPSLMNMELAPKNVKEYNIVVCDTVGFVLVFATTKLLPFLIDELQFHGCMLHGTMHAN